MLVPAIFPVLSLGVGEEGGQPHKGCCLCFDPTGLNSMPPKSVSPWMFGMRPYLKIACLQR